jgi:hypothetical protein
MGPAHALPTGQDQTYLPLNVSGYFTIWIKKTLTNRLTVRFYDIFSNGMNAAL